MIRRKHFAISCLLFLLQSVDIPKAHAAPPDPVNDWDKTGLPGDVSMYAYLPSSMGDKPPILVLIHYCGGTASAVFGQAQGGGLVSAADKYGFMIVAPSSGRCWDIVSNKTRTRDGGGDSHAIVSMVRHAVDQLGGNPDRVYATGDSSGGMMTELLLGLYPDVFKGGSAMAGMPAGCRGDSESGDGGGYSGACAGGNVDRTPAAWGQLVRSFYPEYAGLRPRMQLFHGDNDTLIRYKNHTEAIDEWTDLLGLVETEPAAQSGFKLGTHQATRQTWQGECGLPVFDALTSLGGDHGPSDALFLAEFVVPFLGLDQLGAVDPYVAACDEQMMSETGSGGATGTGGEASMTSTGGADGVGGGLSSGANTGAGGTGMASGGEVNSPSGGNASGLSTGGATTSNGPESESTSSAGCTWSSPSPKLPAGTWGLLTLGTLFSIVRRRHRDSIRRG